MIKAFLSNKYTILIIALTAILIFMHRIDLAAMIVVCLYWTSIRVFTFSKNDTQRLQVLPIIILVSIALLYHKVPGFNNIMYFKNVAISNSSAPYSAYINFDKPFLMLLLVYYYHNNRLTNFKYNEMVQQSMKMGLVAAFFLSILGIILGYLRFDFKIASILPIWMAVNFIVVVSEESFFRGFVQTGLEAALMKNKDNLPISPQKIALIITSIFYGAAYHISGGSLYAALATIAGCFYGYAMMKTKRIEASIIVHFIVNLVHIIFFTYPYAA